MSSTSYIFFCYQSSRSLALAGFGLNQSSSSWGIMRSPRSNDPWDYLLAQGPPGEGDEIRSYHAPLVFPYLAGSGSFSNSNHALNFAGGIFGVFEGLSSSNGYWLGINGKYYPLGWGGNKHAGSRAGALSAANKYKFAGRSTIVLSALLGAYSTFEGFELDGGKFGYNAQYAAASSIGGIGFGIAGAKAGAVSGATIGAWFGGIGVIPGTVIGGVLGGFGLGIGAGYFGSYLGGSWINYRHGR